MIPVREQDIGGAIVRRRIDRGADAPWLAGHKLTREEFMALPPANRKALVNNEMVWLMPKENALEGVHTAAHVHSAAQKPKLGLPNKK